DRRDDLSLRPRRAPHAAPAEGGRDARAGCQRDGDEPMTLDAWLAGHPYLRPLAELAFRVDRAAGGIPTPVAPVPVWESYETDYGKGIPLLHSSAAAVDLEPAGRMALVLLERLASGVAVDPALPGLRLLLDRLQREPEPPRRVAAWLLGEDSLRVEAPGVLRY